MVWIAFIFFKTGSDHPTFFSSFLSFLSMVSMGEYQEVLQPILEENALDIVLFLMSYFAGDKFVLHEVLRMVPNPTSFEIFSLNR